MGAIPEAARDEYGATKDLSGIESRIGRLETRENDAEGEAGETSEWRIVSAVEYKNKSDVILRQLCLFWKCDRAIRCL